MYGLTRTCNTIIALSVAGFVAFLLQGCVKYLEEDLSLNVVLIPALTLGFSIVQVRENIPRIQF